LDFAGASLLMELQGFLIGERRSRAARGRRGHGYSFTRGTRPPAQRTLATGLRAVHGARRLLDGFRRCAALPILRRRRHGACGQKRGRDELTASDLVACRPMTLARSGSLQEDPPGATSPPGSAENGRAAAVPRDGAADATSADDLGR